MHLSVILTSLLEDFAEKTGGRKLDIIETGTIRDERDEYRLNDGWSTVTFAEWVKRNGGTVRSIDLETATAEKVLKAKGLKAQVTLHQGHSIEVLAGMVADAWGRAKKNNRGAIVARNEGFADVAFLDSDNNGALIFHEYLLVKKLMRSPGLIIVDDVDIASTVVVKGHEILPWARANNVEHRIVERVGEGYSTGVLVFEL